MTKPTPDGSVWVSVSTLDLYFFCGETGRGSQPERDVGDSDDAAPLALKTDLPLTNKTKQQTNKPIGKQQTNRRASKQTKLKAPNTLKTPLSLSTFMHQNVNIGFGGDFEETM